MAVVLTPVVPEAAKAEPQEVYAPPATVVGEVQVLLVAGLMVSVKVAFPVPPLLLALSVTVDVAVPVGVPEINPVELLSDKPAGNPVAP